MFSTSRQYAKQRREKYYIIDIYKEGYIIEEGDEESSAKILQPVVATWYKALRIIALVGLLSVLVYVGIRIILSSASAQDKAKYKQMFMDWLVAFCLLFFMHYIMSFSITMVDGLTQSISKNSNYIRFMKSTEGLRKSKSLFCLNRQQITRLVTACFCLQS